MQQEDLTFEQSMDSDQDKTRSITQKYKNKQLASEQPKTSTVRHSEMVPESLKWSGTGLEDNEQSPEQ